MANKLGLTLDIIRYRIKNLLKRDIIIKFFPEISLPKLGYTEYLYTIKLKNLSGEKMIQIRKEIEINSNVTYAFVDSTSFYLIFVCAFKDSLGIDSLSRSLRSDFSDVIESQDYLIIKEQILFNLFPEGLAKK